MIQIFNQKRSELPVLMYDIMHDWERSHTSHDFRILYTADTSPCGSNIKQLLDEVLWYPE